MFKRIYRDRRVLVTGHTGFKGSWLVAWLLSLDARVSGLALDPNEDQRLFGELNLSKRLVSDHRADVRDAAMVARIVEHVRPEFVFHLAAQPLVRRSYEDPLETLGTNVMGTATSARRGTAGRSVVRGHRGDQRQVLRKPRRKHGLLGTGPSRRARSV